MLKNTISLFVILLIFNSCNYFSKPETNFVYDVERNEDIFLKNWKVTGPFYSDSVVYGRALLKYPILNHYKVLNDSSITSEVLNSIKEEGYSDTLFYLNKFKNSKYSQSQGYVNLKNYFDIEKTGIVYLSCNIISDKVKDIAFLLGSDDVCSVYLNGHEIYKSVSVRKYKNSEDRFFGHLEKGENFLLIRLGNVYPKSSIGKNKEEWRFSCNLSSLDRFYNFYLKNQSNYFKSCVVSKFFPLELKDEFHRKRPITKVQIFDADKKLVNIKESKIGINEIEFSDDFDTGLYYADLISKTNTFHQPFFYGDIDKILSDKVLHAQKIIDTCKSVKLKNTLEALITRNNLINEHYFKKKKISIRQFSETKKIDTTIRLLNFPFKWLKLDGSEKIELLTKHKINKPLSEIRFYSEDDRDTEVKPISIQGDVKTYRLADGKQDIAFKTTPISFEFNKDDVPKYMAISPYQSNWEVNLEKNKIFLFKELYDNIQQKHTHKRVGSTLQSFVSKIDNTAQYYTFNTPNKKHTDTIKKPLVIIMPVVETNHLNYLKSTRIANNQTLEYNKALSEKYDCYVAFPGLRTYTKPVITPIVESDFFSLIDDIKSRYPIDTTKVYLAAFCGATPLSLSLAERYPDKISAISIGGGVVSKPRNNYFKTEGAYAMMENLKHTHCYAIHNEYDLHTNIKSISEFVREANMLGVNIEFENLKKTFAIANSELLHNCKMFDFFKDKKETMPKEISFSTYRHKYNKAYWLQLFPIKSGEKANIKAKVSGNKISVTVERAKKLIIYPSKVPLEDENDLLIKINGESCRYSYPYGTEIVFDFASNKKELGLTKNEFVEGPLVDAFGDHFTVVKGSLGSHLDRAYNDSIAKSFINSWHKEYYALPPVTYDKDIDAIDIANSNLVLIGNQNTNALIKKIYKDLPIEIDSQGLKLGNQKYTGSKLGYSIIYPNPLNPDKYIVLLGSNNNHCVYKRKGNMAVDGYYDYEIENVFDDRMIKQGYFNESWGVDD